LLVPAPKLTDLYRTPRVSTWGKPGSLRKPALRTFLKLTVWVSGTSMSTLGVDGAAQALSITYTKVENEKSRKKAMYKLQVPAPPPLSRP